MSIRIILDLDDEALAALQITPEECPHAAASYLERLVASDLNGRGLPDGGHVTSIFCVLSSEAKGGLTGWVRWSTDADGVYGLRPDEPEPARRVPGGVAIVDPTAAEF